MDHVLEEVKKISMKYNVKKVILFGSRARKEHSSISDYDIAVFAKELTAIDKAYFREDIEELSTLKKFDIIFLNENSDEKLMENIKKEGVVIWEN